MIELRATGLSVESDGHVLVDHADISVAPGELVVLLGPNGAGKTSLLRALVGLQRPYAGEALLDGRASVGWPAMERARKLAYLPQSRPLAWPTRVRDVVALGRFAHGAATGRLRGADRDAVEHAIAICAITDLADRSCDTLSGGELARVHIARAFAAQTPLLVADEPIAALDPRHQIGIMNLIADYVAKGGGALVVLHDLGMAARYADRLVWMKQARIIAQGSVGDTMTADMLASVYGVVGTVDNGAVTIQDLTHSP